MGGWVQLKIHRYPSVEGKRLVKVDNVKNQIRAGATFKIDDNQCFIKSVIEFLRATRITPQLLRDRLLIAEIFDGEETENGGVEKIK